jgi:hypothetical protein
MVFKAFKRLSFEPSHRVCFRSEACGWTALENLRFGIALEHRGQSANNPGMQAQLELREYMKSIGKRDDHGDRRREVCTGKSPTDQASANGFA